MGNDEGSTYQFAPLTGSSDPFVASSSPVFSVQFCGISRAVGQKQVRTPSSDSFVDSSSPVFSAQLQKFLQRFDC